MTKQPFKNRLIAESDDEPASVEPAEVPQRARVSETRTPRRSEGKGPYPGRRQVTAHIDRHLFLWLKRISAETETPMVEIFEAALLSYVERWQAQKKFGQA